MTHCWTKGLHAAGQKILHEQAGRDNGSSLQTGPARRQLRIVQAASGELSTQIMPVGPFGFWPVEIRPRAAASEFNLLHSEAREKKVTVGQVSRREGKKNDLIKIEWSRLCPHRSSQ